MILIIQNGYITPCMVKYLDEDSQIVKSYEIDVSKINLDHYSMIIITGGPQSVTRISKYPNLLNVVILIQKCLNIKKPLFGICLGSQLIAYTLGCQIKSSGKMNSGYDTKILGYDNIFRSHIDYIVPNDQITVLEYFESMPYFYTHGDHIIGIQCHPDITPECIHKYTSNQTTVDYATINKKIINEKNQAIIKYIINKLIQ